jgi:hypothetical protein
MCKFQFYFCLPFSLKMSYVKKYKKVKKCKAVPVTGLEGTYGCETSRLPHFLDNRSQMTVSLSALRAGRPLPLLGRFLVLISVRG